MEHTIQESKKQYVLVLVLIPENVWRKDPTLPMNFANNLLRSIDTHEREFLAINPCTFLCAAETVWHVSPQISEIAKVYKVETQILFLDQKPSWLTS